jgi:hypothetical protein
MFSNTQEKMSLDLPHDMYRKMDNRWKIILKSVLDRDSEEGH